MDGPGDYHTERRKSEKDKYHISLTCAIKKNDIDELIYKTETDLENELMVTSGGVCVGKEG